MSVSRGTSTDIPGLQSNHKEADPRLLLHAKHAADNATRVVIQSPDTDVLVICTSHFQQPPMRRVVVSNRREGPVTIYSCA